MAHSSTIKYGQALLNGCIRGRWPDRRKIPCLCIALLDSLDPALFGLGLDFKPLELGHA